MTVQAVAIYSWSAFGRLLDLVQRLRCVVTVGINAGLRAGLKRRLMKKALSVSGNRCFALALTSIPTDELISTDSSVGNTPLYPQTKTDCAI